MSQDIENMLLGRMSDFALAFIIVELLLRALRKAIKLSILHTKTSISPVLTLKHETVMIIK